ncbi:hypothetical protein N8I77_000135 [Diaporthe amygdali]|uniref:Ribosomal protein S21 n=1 Tax=Phomopsis amygdali TaxID=1214568 RepID=A0AAD9SLL9_PHOAM|nr:hypothetical protein N8I77_000135 [Diaporthe amygdali]
MELRPVQAVLLAGRSASRRAIATPSTLSYPLAFSLYRSVSSTRPSLSEAEATAPAPTPSLSETNRQHQQQHQQQSSQQPRASPSPNLASNNRKPAAAGLSSLLTPNNSTAAAPPPSSSTTPPPTSKDSLLTPWATPSSPGLRRSQANRTINPSDKYGILETLQEMNLVAPNMDDLLNNTALQTESAADIKYRLRPSVGRTVHLDSRVDLARGLNMLNFHVRRNKVVQDLARQRFHERPGLKRKRLRSERWRARFKDGFKATCKRVTELARQGW